PIAPATLPRLLRRLPRGQPSSDAPVDPIAWVVKSPYVKRSYDVPAGELTGHYVPPDVVKVPSPKPNTVKHLVGANDLPSGHDMHSALENRSLGQFLNLEGRKRIYGTDDVMFENLMKHPWRMLNRIWLLVPAELLEGLEPQEVQGNLDFVGNVMYALYQLSLAEQVLKVFSTGVPITPRTNRAINDFTKEQGITYRKYLDAVDLTALKAAGIFDALVRRRPGLARLYRDFGINKVGWIHRSLEATEGRRKFQKLILFNSIVSNELGGYLNKRSSRPLPGALHAMQTQLTVPINILWLVTLRIRYVMGLPNFEQVLKVYVDRHGVLDGGVLLSLGVVDWNSSWHSPFTRPDSEGGTASIPLLKLDKLWFTGLQHLIGRAPWEYASRPNPTRAAPDAGQSTIGGSTIVDQQPQFGKQGSVQAETGPLSSASTRQSQYSDVIGGLRKFTMDFPKTSGP
ncbi:hypothetical protein CXG81DRAFT_21162, partial [Caulochytrium protostelioides]